MKIQEACDIIETLLAQEADTEEPKLTTQQWNALNRILLDLQISGAYKLPKGIH